MQAICEVFRNLESLFQVVPVILATGAHLLAIGRPLLGVDG